MSNKVKGKNIEDPESEKLLNIYHQNKKEIQKINNQIERNNLEIHELEKELNLTGGRK